MKNMPVPPTDVRGDEIGSKGPLKLFYYFRVRVLGGRPVVGHMPLEHGTLVRIQASQPDSESVESKGRRDG